ncbi:MAG: hypothetical protein AAGF11_53815, partial [Myxococcota bacterium]
GGGAWGGAGRGCDPAPGEPGSDEPAADARGALELGQLGEGRDFVPYEPAQVVEIHQGLQGGFHIFVDGRLTGDPLDDDCLVTLRMFRMDDDSEVTTIQHLREPDLLPDLDGNRTLDDLIVFISDPAALDGVDVRLEAMLDMGEASLEGDEVLLHLRLADDR